MAGNGEDMERLGPTFSSKSTPVDRQVSTTGSKTRSGTCEVVNASDVLDCS